MAKYGDKIKQRIADLWESGEMTIPEICEIVGITKTTFHRWKSEKSDFCDELNAREDLRYQKIANMAEGSIKKLIQGFEYEETTMETNETDDEGNLSKKRVTTKTVLPHPNSVIFALKNTRSDRWKDKTETDITSDGESIKVPNFKWGEK